jgi:hypothetical protein
MCPFSDTPWDTSGKTPGPFLRPASLRLGLGMLSGCLGGPIVLFG